MEFVKLRSFYEYRDYQKIHYKERIKLEERILKEFWKNKHDLIIGFCKLCEKSTRFKFHINQKGEFIFRESLLCEYCNLDNRERFMLNFLKEFVQKSNSSLTVYMYEQITNLFKYAQNFQKIDLVGSEFLGYDKKPGQIIKNIRNEDAMNLSFQNNSFDVIVSNDVYEHIPNINKALVEAHRVLKNSGILLISIPFYTKNYETIRCATLEKGKIKHILPPEYHQNPVTQKEGSLVFYDYGWDILDMLKTAGFSDAYMLVYYDIFYGHIGKALQFIFVAEK